MNVFDLYAKISLDQSEYDKGLANSESKAHKLGGKIKNGLVTVGKVSAAAIGAATTAVGGFAVSAINAGKDFDASMAQVAATMGTTVDQIGDLRDFAQEMGRTTAFSATQAADALNYMALAGYDATTSMQMLPNVLNLAAAGGIELAQASDMVTDAQSALGLSLEETNTMVDQMAAASSKSNTSVAQLGEAFLTIGATARNLKGGTQELSTVLGVLADNGIKGAEGGTHLRNAILSLQTPTKDGIEALKKLGMSYEDMYDEAGNMRALPEIFEQMSTAMEGMNQQSKDAIISGVFNKTDLAAINALIGTNKERWDELSGAIGDSTDAAQKMANTQLDNLAGDITLFKSALEGAQIAISDGMTPTLRNFVKLGTGSLSELTYAFQTKGIDGVMRVVPRILNRVIKLILDTMPKLINTGIQLLSAVGQGLLDNMDLIISAMTEILLNVATALASGIPAFIDGAFQIVLGIANGLIEALPELIPAAIQMIEKIVATLEENLPLLLNAALEIIMAIANGLITMLPTLIPSIVNIIMNIVNILIANVSQLISAAVEIIMAIANGLIDALPELIPAVIDIILQIADALIDNLDQLLTATVEIMIAIGEGLINAMPEILTRIPEIFQKMYDKFLEMDWASIGMNLIEGIGKGILDAGKNLVEKAKSVVRQAFNAQKQTLDEHSPSKRAEREIGAMWSAGIGIGFTKEMPKQSAKMVSAIEDAFNGLQGAVNGSVSAGTAQGGESIGGTFAPVINVYGAQGQDVNDLADIVMDKMTRELKRRRGSYAIA